MSVDIAFITVNYNTLDCVKHLADFFNALDVPFTFTFTVVDTPRMVPINSCNPARKSTISKLARIWATGVASTGSSRTASKYVCVTNTDVILNRDALVDLWLPGRTARSPGSARRGSPMRMDATREWCSKLLFFKLCQLVCQAPGELREAENCESDHAAESRRRDGRFFLIQRSVIPHRHSSTRTFSFFTRIPCWLTP